LTARAASRDCNPSATSTRLALGDNWTPAPISSRRSAFSRTTTRNPRAASASEAVNPPIPAPATKMVRDAATARSGCLVLYDAFGRAGLAGFEVSGETKKRRAVRTDDFVVVTEVQEDMRVIERRIGAHAHELVRADFDHRNACIVVEVRNNMVGHLYSPCVAMEQHSLNTPQQHRKLRTILADTVDS
jgi:hypothetical protein